MGFLDKKTRVMDVHLTALGRDLLAQNQLNIAHYAFSDELIDYSGSLSQSIAQSSSIDEVVYKNFVPLECTAMSYIVEPRDLSSFLYTCPEQRDSLPPFKSSVSGASDLTRMFTSYTFDAFVASGLSDTTNPQFVIVTQRDDTSVDDRESQYFAEQTLSKIEDKESAYYVTATTTP